MYKYNDSKNNLPFVIVNPQLNVGDVVVGDREGEKVGNVEGGLVGDMVGNVEVGDKVGDVEGTLVGLRDGCKEGKRVGVFDGAIVGNNACAVFYERRNRNRNRNIGLYISYVSYCNI